MQTHDLAPDDPYAAEAAQLTSRRRLAELMVRSGMDPSPILAKSQGWARVAQAVLGSRDLARVSDEERALAGRREHERSGSYAKLAQLLAPPIQGPGMPQFDDEGNQMPGNVAATGARKRALAEGLLGDRNTAIQRVAFEALTAREAPPVVKEAGGKIFVLGPDGSLRATHGGGPELGKLDPKDYTPESWAEFTRGGGQDTTRLRRFDKPPESVASMDEMIRRAGIDPAGEIGKRLYAAAAQKQSSHAPGTTVNVDTARKPMSAAIGEGIGKDFAAARQAAMAAQRSIQVADEAEKIIESGVFTGAGAMLKLQAGKYAQAVGFKGDRQTIANTEALIANMSQQTLANIRQSGLGGGNGFSNADRDFLQKASGGDIDMTEAGLRKLIDLNRRSSANILRGFDAQASQLERMPEYQGIPLRLGVGEQGGQLRARDGRTVDDILNLYRGQ